jgi:putative NADH-flavin reductase
MNITLFGAAGMVGKRLVNLALARGYYVTAFDRNIEELIDTDKRNDHLTAVKGYVFDESDVLKAVKNAHAVLSVIGGALDGTDKTRSLGIKNIIRQMEKAGVKRIVALGDIGILNADENTYMFDTPDFPYEKKELGQEHLRVLHMLESSPLDWTLACPAAISDRDGNGQFLTNDNYPPEPGNGEITAGDLADFMLTEITANLHLYQRVGISNK